MLKKSMRTRLGQSQKSERKFVFNKVKVYSVFEWTFRRTRDSRGWQGIEKRHSRWKKKTLDDGQYGSEEQQETKGFGDSTECGLMQGILGLSDSGDRCREGGPREEAIFDVGDARLRLASRFFGERPCCGMIACLYEE